jgi:hypothetical protein
MGYNSIFFEQERTGKRFDFNIEKDNSIKTLLPHVKKIAMACADRRLAADLEPAT